MPLTGFSPDNGSTEFWLGSHAHTTSSDQIPTTEKEWASGQVPGEFHCNVRPEVYENRRSVRPPIQVVCEQGDILIRDLRTWHAGMPNTSGEDRIMAAIGYQVHLLHLLHAGNVYLSLMSLNVIGTLVPKF